MEWGDSPIAVYKTLLNDTRTLLYFIFFETYVIYDVENDDGIITIRVGPKFEVCNYFKVWITFIYIY